MESFKDQLEVALQQGKCDSSHGIIIFAFLRNWIRETNLAVMSEARTYVTLPGMLRKSAHEHFVAIRDCL